MQLRGAGRPAVSTAILSVPDGLTRSSVLCYSIGRRGGWLSVSIGVACLGACGAAQPKHFSWETEEVRRLIRKAVFAIGVAEIAGAAFYPLVASGTQLAILLRAPELHAVMCLLAVLAIVLAADYVMNRPRVERSETVGFPSLGTESRGGHYRTVPRSR